MTEVRDSQVFAVLVFDLHLSPLTSPPAQTKAGRVARLLNALAAPRLLSSNQFTEWLQAVDSLRKVGFPASDSDSWGIPREAAEVGK